MRRTILIILFSILVIYSIYQGRFLILGPQIWVDNIKDGATVREPVITVAGRARNVSWISLNDRQIFTDEKGYWSEKLAVSEGVSFISVKARDRFGHEVNKNLQIVLN